MLDLSNFYALKIGVAPLYVGSKDEVAVYQDSELKIKKLGNLLVPSGKLAATDPFVNIHDPSVIEIPKGEYPVYVTIADVSEAQDGSHYREAYLSIKLSTEEAVALAPTLLEDSEPLQEGYFHGIGVDAGTVGFFDAVTSKDFINRIDYDDQFDSWFDEMDSNDGAVMITEVDGELTHTFAISHSGWGDGFYPLLTTLDAEGNLTGVHIDLQVVGIIPEED